MCVFSPTVLGDQPTVGEGSKTIVHECVDTFNVCFPPLLCAGDQPTVGEGSKTIVHECVDTFNVCFPHAVCR